MSPRRHDGQADLFHTSRPRELQSRVKELDRLIARAIKSGDFHRARALTEEQKMLIQELVQLREGPDQSGE
jgi:hypothetical protein